LKAWKIVAAHMPAARLVIGGDGPMAAEVIAATEQLPRCEYLGQVDGGRKKELLDRCLAMVIPSVWWEPLGLVVYEAYDHGKPVLAARAGGLAETVLPGETGWLHAPGNVQELAAQMIEAAENPDETRRRGMGGRRWLLENTRTTEWLDEFGRIAEQLVRAKKTRNRTFH
ncbi:MAG TPA: glycosyltransferase, partial [Luteolibacter sp.]